MIELAWCLVLSLFSSQLRHDVRVLLALSVFLFASFAQASPNCLTEDEWRSLGEMSWTLHKVEQYSGGLFGPNLNLGALDEGLDKKIDSKILEAGLFELKRIYHAHGYFKATLTSCLKVHSLAERELDLTVNVDLGDRAYIREIHFQGVRGFDTKRVESVMLSGRQSGWTQFLATMGFGAPQIEEDKARIIAFYQSEGFLDVRILDVRLKVSDDFEFCDLDFEIDEGERYKVGKIEPSSLSRDISFKAGDVFDLPQLTNNVERMLIPVKDEGFAFAKATPELTLNKDVLSVRYDVEKGERIIVRSVIAKGNDYSEAQVITSEFLDLEGAPYNYSQTEIKRLRLLSKGGFTDAKVTLAPTSVHGIYDLVIRVKEKFPMRFNLAPYYLSGEGLILSAYVLHQNLFGRGVYGLVAAQLSSRRQTFELAFYEPHLGGRNVSWLTEIHDRQYEYFSFSSFSLGGAGRLNFRINDHFALGTGFNIDELSVTTSKASALFAPYVQLPSGNMRNAIYVSASLQPLAASLDLNQQLSFDAKVTYSGAPTMSEFEFAELAFGIRWGFSLSPFVLRGRIAGGILLRLSDSLLPITERYFLGGQSTLRGYQIFSVGPWIAATSNTPAIQIGGVKKISQTIEVEFPIMKFLELKGYIFTDMGNAYSEKQSFFEGGLAASIGFGATAAPWGIAVKCELAKALVNLPGALGFDFYIGLSTLTW
jgi:outer membrane protein insertion porin family